MESQLSTTASARLMPRPSPTGMVPMASHMPTAMESQLSTTASARLMPRPSPTGMVPMASHMPTAMESQLSTTASARLRPMLSPTMVSMEPMVSQLSPPTDTHLSTTM